VAEDNLVNQKVISRLLAKLGCDVTLVGDGQAAIEAVTSGSFDIVFMDCQMPILDGYEATARIREAEPTGEHVTIVALTANALAGDREACLCAGMDDYLSKPVQRRSVELILERWCTPVEAT
jgi:CheY-like chemotaxis protein